MLDFFILIILIFTLLVCIKNDLSSTIPRCNEFCKHFTNDTFLHSQIFFRSDPFRAFQYTPFVSDTRHRIDKKNWRFFLNSSRKLIHPICIFPVTFHFDTFSVFFPLNFFLHFFNWFFFHFLPNFPKETNVNCTLICTEFQMNFQTFSTVRRIPKTVQHGNQANKSDALFLLSQKGYAYFYHRHKYKWLLSMKIRMQKKMRPPWPILCSVSLPSFTLLRIFSCCFQFFPSFATRKTYQYSWCVYICRHPMYINSHPSERMKKGHRTFNDCIMFHVTKDRLMCTWKII